MLHIWISDYIPNTFTYAIFTQNFLSYNLTYRDLPSSLKSLLSTTCSTDTCCLGNVFPELSSSYPNSFVEIEMAVVKAPTTNISSSKIQVTSSGYVTFRLRSSNGSDVEVLKINVELNVIIALTLTKNLFKCNVTDLIPAVEVVSSSVGSISSASLSKALDTLCTSIVIPALNKKGQRGVPFPVLRGILFNNADLEMRDHCLYITTDVRRSKLPQHFNKKTSNNINHYW